MPKYSIVEGRDFTGNKTWDALQAASDEQLEKWAADENCKQRDNAAQELEDRRQRRIAAEYRASIAPKPQEQDLASMTRSNAAGMPSTTVTTSLNLGTVVFVGFALLSLFVSLAEGVVPIYLVEAALWAGLAWYWDKKGSTSQSATLIILLCAMTVAAGEGYLVGRNSKAGVGSSDPYAEFGGSIGASPTTKTTPGQSGLDMSRFQPLTPTAPSNSIDRWLQEHPNPPAVTAPEHPKKAKPAPVLGYATVLKEENIYMRCAFNTGYEPCLMYDANDSSGTIARLKKDDRVEILSEKVRAPDGTDIYKARFQQHVGWMAADNLVLEAR